MQTVTFLTLLVERHQIWAYAVIFLGLIFEGEVVVITTGVLAYLGALDFWLSLTLIFSGSFVKTFVLYYIGERVNERYGQSKFFKYIEKRISYLAPSFKKKPFWTIFFSKFIMGTNYLVILFSGYHKVKFKTYCKAEIISTFIWAPALLSLGFFFSETAISVSREISKFSVVIFIMIAIFLLFDKIASSVFTFYEYLKNGINGINGNGYNKE